MDKPEFRVERGPETEPEPFAIGMAKLLEREGRTVAAAELRRLHAENEAFNAENEKLRSERTLLVRKVEALETDIEIERRLSFRNQVAKLEDENEALLEALEFCAGTSCATDANDVARAAIAAVEGEKT